MFLKKHSQPEWTPADRQRERLLLDYFAAETNLEERLFGHSSALITMRYIGIADEEEKKAYHDVSIDLLGDI